jgi:hypothetical protein
MSVPDPITLQLAQRQVRLQLTTGDEEVALPDNTGPILVPTGTLMQNLKETTKKF